MSLKHERNFQILTILMTTSESRAKPEEPTKNLFLSLPSEDLLLPLYKLKKVIATCGLRLLSPLPIEVKQKDYMTLFSKPENKKHSFAVS